MIIKTITLKFTTGNQTIVVHTDSERDFARRISDLIRETGAIGFSTQSTVVVPAI